MITANSSQKWNHREEVMDIYAVKHYFKCQQQKPVTNPKHQELTLTTEFLNEELATEAISGPCIDLLPLADSEVVTAKLIHARLLAKDQTRLDERRPCIKTSIELTLKFNDHEIPYKPGDSFGFICHNSPDEVTELLERLNAAEFSDKACTVTVKEGISSKKTVPPHIPALATLRHIFTSCLDIRAVPKKVLLRTFAQFCEDETENLCLQFLASPEGSHHYVNCVREVNLCVQDILKMFPSCLPPVESLIEHLPALKPRFYSVASSPLTSAHSFQVVFSVVEMTKGGGRQEDRKGVCTGELEKISERFMNKNCGALDVTKSMSELHLSKENTLPVISLFRKRNCHFYLPEDPAVPIIMVGPGTGVAPFIGFLWHREKQKEESINKIQFGKMWLIYGCRYEDKDFLYREELKRFQESGLLSKLLVCFSREKPLDSDHCRHVQDLIMMNKKDIINMVEDGAVTYVCGDEKHMAKDIRSCFTNAVCEVKGYTKDEAKDFMRKLDHEKRYLIDVWA